MARKYKRDGSGRFAGGGGGSSGGGSKRPAAKTVSRGVNRLTRDNAGKITSVGGEGATARGGRLRTAAGNKRAMQTAKVSGGKPSGTIGKARGLKPQSAKPAPSAATIAQVGRERRATRHLNAAMKRESEGPNSKASRSASVAKRASAIYAGKVDPKQKTAARLTRTNNPEALRKRVAKIKDNTKKKR